MVIKSAPQAKACFSKMRYLFVFLLIILFSGCATVSSVERSFRSVNFSDGISRQEAKIIAKKEIIQTDFKDNYRVICPKVWDRAEFNRVMGSS